MVFRGSPSGSVRPQPAGAPEWSPLGRLAGVCGRSAPITVSEGGECPRLALPSTSPQGHLVRPLCSLCQQPSPRAAGNQVRKPRPSPSCWRPCSQTRCGREAVTGPQARREVFSFCLKGGQSLTHVPMGRGACRVVRATAPWPPPQIYSVTDPSVPHGSQKSASSSLLQGHGASPFMVIQEAGHPLTYQDPPLQTALLAARQVALPSPRSRREGTRSI